MEVLEIYSCKSVFCCVCWCLWASVAFLQRCRMGSAAIPLPACPAGTALWFLPCWAACSPFSAGRAGCRCGARCFPRREQGFVIV